MKLGPDDPRLSAYLLGELPPDEAAAVERAAAADPALGMALREMEHTQRLLADTLAAGSSPALLPRQRDTILRAARHADQSGITTTMPSLRRPLKPLLFPVAAAAVATLATFLLIRLPSGTNQTASPAPPPGDSSTPPLEVALLPAPGPPDVSRSSRPEARPAASPGPAKPSATIADDGDPFLRKVADHLSDSPHPAEADLPKLRPRGMVSASENPTLPLPVHAGRASLDWVTRSILQNHQLPPANAVRLEEILNRFVLRPNGPAAISQGVTLSTESASCPWKPSSTLLLVSFRGSKQAASEVTATLHADSLGVSGYRLLGFAPVEGLETGPLPTSLPAETVTSLVIEFTPSATAAGELGSIHWSVNGHPAAPVKLGRHGDGEPSADAQFAALVCTYAQWLAHDSPGMIDAGLLAALARESASGNLPADRVDFLNLIDRSLDL